MDEKQEKQEKVKGLLSRELLPINAQLTEILNQANLTSQDLSSLISTMLLMSEEIKLINENIKILQANIEKNTQENKNDNKYLAVLLESNLSSSNISPDAFVSGSTKPIETPTKSRAKAAAKAPAELKFDSVVVDSASINTLVAAPKKKTKAATSITEAEFFKREIKELVFVKKLFDSFDEHITTSFINASKINIKDMEQSDKIETFIKYTSEKVAASLIAAIKKNVDVKSFITEEYNIYKSHQLINDGKGNLSEDLSGESGASLGI